MKRISLLLTALVASCQLLTAQITEGHVSYNMEFNIDDPQAEMMASMMQGAKMELYFREGASTSVVSMGMVGTTTTISSSESKKSLTLMEGMMGNIAMWNEFEETTDETPEIPENLKITETNETKDILGHTCKKVIIQNTEDDGSESIIWFTEDVKVFKGGQSFLSANIQGFPLEFEMNFGGSTMKFIAQVFETELDSVYEELFDMTIPEGFKEMTQEDMMKMGMQMGN